jgi:hypothetical protein
VKQVQQLAGRTPVVVMLAALTVLLVASSVRAQAPGSYTKAVVGDHIKKVEDGVDEFRKYLENRGEDVKNNGKAAQNSGTPRGRSAPANTEARKDQARRTKDELDDALDDLNGATNRLRRKFSSTSKYMETKSQMENVMESARRVNQVMVKGNYGTQAERYWTPLRKYINDLARTYGIAPMGV